MFQSLTSLRCQFMSESTFEMIWESIAAFPEAIAVSLELKSELDARLADFERNPEAGTLMGSGQRTT